MAGEIDIRTPRLIFGRHRLEDLPDCVAMWGDLETMRHIAPPSTPEESWARLLRNVGQWALLGHGSWVLRDPATGQFVGEVGFKQFRRSLDPAWDELPEIGWALAGPARGQGLSTEAALAALAWADAHLDAARVLCMIDPANAASLRVAARCGFGEIARVTYKDKPVIIFERAVARKVGGDVPPPPTPPSHMGLAQVGTGGLGGPARSLQFLPFDVSTLA